MNQKLVIGNRFSFSNRNKAALSIETNKNSTTTTTTTTELEPSSPPSSTSASDSSNNQQQQQQLTNPTSSLAARIGNVMVDPYNPSSSTLLSHKAGVGAGAFVYKVYNMLLDPAFQHLISFNPNGQSFTVNNVQDFSKTVLPKQFKHNNFSSFVRQLNMYGFHKVNKTPRGQRGNDNSAAWEFVHPKFHRGRPDLLEQIRRKTLENDSASHSLRHKDHHHHHHHHHDQAFINQSSPTTTQRFPLDPATAFLPTVQHPHPNFQPLVPHNTRLFFPHLQQQPSSSQSESQPELSPAGPTASFNLPDLSSNPTLPSSSLFEGSPHPTITPNNNTADHSLHEFQSSHHYTHSFPQSSYPIDPPSSSHSHVSSAPITPLSAVPPPPSSPMDMNLDPNVFAKEPLETLADVKHQMSGHFQGINASYEALYQELHETRRRQGVLIDLVEKMYKTLQSTPNTNIGYEFPSRDLLGAETTPIFKITEHNHPDHFPMVYEDINSQQHCSVSVGTSPSVSEFSHAAQTSPCHSTFRSLSVGPAGFAGFGNLTLASYPNSPVGARINDQQTNTTGTNSPPSVMQNHQGGGPSLMDDGANRFLVPSLSSSHHPQQVLGNSNNNNNNNDINSAPVSPRAVLSAAMKTPLPPSPAPFKQIIQAASGQAEMKATQRTDEYHQAMDSFLHLHHHHHHHHAGLSIGGLKEAAASSTFAAAPPSIEPTHLPTHAEECIHLGPGADRSQAFDRLVVSPSPDNLVFASSTSPPSLVHLHHPPPHPTPTPNQHHRRHRHQQQQYPQQQHHPQASAHPSHHLLPSSEENAIAVCLAPLADPCLSSAAASSSSATLPLASPAAFKGKKRPASGSIDLPSSSSLENRLPIIPPN